MTATFLGKWRFHIPPIDFGFVCTDGWAAYECSPGLPIRVDGWSAWYTYDYYEGNITGPFLPGKETNTALILRADEQLCFLLNNGQYLGSDEGQLVFVDTLDQASGFAFPGYDFNNVAIRCPLFKRRRTATSVCVVGPGDFLSLFDQGSATVFTISQVTPSLYSLRATGKGDGCDFAWVDFTGCFFRTVSLAKADFSHCNLTKTTFINCNFTSAVLTNVNLTGAMFNNCIMDGALLNNCILTDTNFTDSILRGTHLEGATFQGTILSNTRLVGAFFKQSDLTSVIAYPTPQFYNTPLAPPSSTNPRTTFSGCRLDQSLIGNDWSMLDLTGSTILGLSSPLSSPANPLKATYAILKGLNNNNLIGLSLQSAVFDYAVLDELGLNSSGEHITDLSGASLIQASMHGTNLTGTILKGANMTGAQLGSLGQLFTLATNFVADLNAGSIVDAALRAEFTQHGIALSATAALSIRAPNRVWELNDLGNNTIYTIRLDTEADKTPILTVYVPAISASLVEVYMPNAVLTGANLYGVLASRAQFYGDAARIDGSAILESVEFNDANLSNLNLTQAYLYGANLSGAQLFNAHFNKATLTPSADGVATNLSGANLHGADFTDAQLFGANLDDAAVAINVSTKANPDQGGVYLFSLPYSSKDIHCSGDYIAELNAAAKVFSLNPQGDAATLQKYVTALETNNLPLLKIAFLQHQFTLSDAAQIQPVTKGEVWQIVDGPQSYSLWVDPDEQGNTELYAAPSLSITGAAFQQNSITLRWQTSAAVDVPGQQWLLDNDSENPQNFSTGYVRFILRLNRSVLDVYGAAVRVERLGDKQQLEMDTENCNVTTLAVTNMNPQTVCPNGTKVSDQPSEETWEQWLRAAKPPTPPTCVPTDYQWCPPSSKTKETEGGGSLS